MRHYLRNVLRDPVYAGTMIAVGCAAVFGIWPAAIRGFYMAGGTIGFALLVTTWMRGLFLAGYCLLSGKHIFATRQARQQALWGGVFQFMAVFGLYKALEILPGPLTMVLLFTHTLMLLFYMAWRGEVRLDRFTVIVTCAALIGLTFVLDLWHPQPAGHVWGIIFSLVAAVATASRLYVTGKQMRGRHPIVVGAENFLSASLIICVIPLVEPTAVPSAAAQWVYLGTACAVVTAGTFGMFYGISLLGAFRWSLFSKIEPVFTALFSAVLVGEVLKWHQYMGMLLVLGSLIAYQVMERKRLKRVPLEKLPAGES